MEKIHNTKKYSKKDDETIVKMRKDGESWETIATTLKRASGKAVQMHAKYYNLPVPRDSKFDPTKNKPRTANKKVRRAELIRTKIIKNMEKIDNLTIREIIKKFQIEDSHKNQCLVNTILVELVRQNKVIKQPTNTKKPARNVYSYINPQTPTVTPIEKIELLESRLVKVETELAERDEFEAYVSTPTLLPINKSFISKVKAIIGVF